jgi:hypothetical protein
MKQQADHFTCSSVWVHGTQFKHCFTDGVGHMALLACAEESKACMDLNKLHTSEMLSVIVVLHTKS